MKRFIFRLFVFFVLVLIGDFIFGIVFSYMSTHSKGGEFERMSYIKDRMKDNILIMGSSRARHHYDSNLIADSLNTSCVNLGSNGMGIIFSYAQLQLFQNRYKPDLIIYEYTLEFDYDTAVDNLRFFNKLKPYYGQNQSIDDMLLKYDMNNKITLQSNLWKYNTIFITLVKGFVSYADNENINKGYSPLFGTLNKEPIQNILPIQSDNLKTKYFNDFVKECIDNNISLIVMVSPKYLGQSKIKSNNLDFSLVENICNEYNVPYFNFYDDPEFQNKIYFKDSQHLNKEGSEKYTNKIIPLIKDIHRDFKN